MKIRVVLYITGVNGYGVLMEKIKSGGKYLLVLPIVEVPPGNPPDFFTCDFMVDKFLLPINGFIFKIMEEPKNEIISHKIAESERCRVYKYNIGIMPGHSPGMSWTDTNGCVHEYEWKYDKPN